MLTTTQCATMVPSSPPSAPRLSLAPAGAGQAVLNGGWWPRSWDPMAELPGLVLAVASRYGPIRQLMLNDAWDSRFRQLAVGAGAVRMGWYATLDPALLIATTDRGDQLDLLVVPPKTAAATAERAMAAGADPANTMRAPNILAAVPAAAVPAPGNGPDPGAVGENEGGHISAFRPHRPANARATATSS